MSPINLQDIESTGGDTRRDLIIDAFEEQWLSGSAPDIVETCYNYLANDVATDQQTHLLDFLLELAIVDLELRWRVGGPEAKRSTDWYRKSLSRFGFDDDQLRILAFNELEVRSRWGDSPQVDQLVLEQFPDASKQELAILISQFHSELELRFPIICNVSCESTHRFRTVLKTPCVVGRQRSSDPAVNEIRHCDRDQMDRMVIADRTENFISRVQLRLERLSVNELKVTPLSRSVPCFIGSRRLPDHVGTVLPVPLRGAALAFGGFLMHFNRL